MTGHTASTDSGAWTQLMESFSLSVGPKSMGAAHIGVCLLTSIKPIKKKSLTRYGNAHRKSYYSMSLKLAWSI